MGRALQRVVEAFAVRGEEIARRATEVRDAAPTERRSDPKPSDLLAVVFDTFDVECGGFGTEPKFPLPAALELAIEESRRSADAAMNRIVGTTLDAMGWGDLYDEIDGGFFRCADTRDWRRPRTEKMLDVNAALLRVYLAAAEVEGLARYRERAQDVLRYVQTWLADPVDGGWSGSQQADELYYERRSPDARRTQPPPAIDRVLYTDWNASMVSAALTAANALDDRALGEFALKSMERVLLACYAPGAGVAHCYDGSVGVRGLLVDQMAMAAALLDAYEATGNLPYEMMAEELAHYALRTMWDARAGGFYDRAPAEASDAVGLLRRRQKPFVANCDAARVLHRLAATSGNHEFADAARGALTTVAPQAAGHGALAAHYVLAEREVAHTSLQLPQG
jgi:hypothetical protein